MVTAVPFAALLEGRALEEISSMDESRGEQRRVTTVGADHLLSQEIDGEMVLLDLRSGMYLGLNGVGTFVWKLISSRESPVGVGEIAEAVAAEFDVATATARRDLDQLLEELSSNRLVHIVA
jgi:hypothetical protein